MRYSRTMTIGPVLTPMVKTLILVCVGVFLWTSLAGSGLRVILGLNVDFWRALYLWQPLTYIFLHGDFWHIFFNMFALWMFGPELERMWGSRAFLRFFLVTGVGAGLLSLLSDPYAAVPTIGASGSIYGILMAFGMLFPNRIVHLYFLFPIKVKYFVAALMVMAFISASSGMGSGIAHFAHLGGALMAFLHLKGWLSPGFYQQAYYRWKLRRHRARFRVYENKTPPTSSRRGEDDFWIN